jgi:hypothetical protein
VGIFFIKQLIRKDASMIIIFIIRFIPITPKQVVNAIDLGYLGIEKDFPEQLSALPYRKERNHKLSNEQKEYHKIHSKKRIVM